MENGSGKQLPKVSVLVPMYNEENYIEQCLLSLINQDYPKQSFEILVIDGGSDDHSVDIVSKYIPSNNIKLIDNPKKKQSSALNIGIKNSTGDIIVRMDAHARAPENYLTLCINYLLEKNASSVGGLMNPIGEGFWGKSIALGTSHPFGVGDSKHRTSKTEGYDEPGWLGSFLKESLEDLNGYNENVGFNEDDDLFYRLIKSGRKVFRTPEIKIDYYPRSSLSKLFSQYYKYGYWKIPVIKQFGNITAIRHFIPALFVLFLIVSTIFCVTTTSTCLISGIIFAPYVLLSLWFSFRLALNSKIRFFFSLPIIFFTLHFSYGIGFILGLMRYLLFVDKQAKPAKEKI